MRLVLRIEKLQRGRRDYAMALPSSIAGPPYPVIMGSRTPMRSRLRTSRHRRTRRAPDQQPGRRVPARVTGAAVASLAGPVQPEFPDEGREVREMGKRDLCGGRQMLQTVRQNVPRRVTPEDLSDPSLLRARKHGRELSRTPTADHASTT